MAFVLLNAGVLLVAAATAMDVSARDGGAAVRLAGRMAEVIAAAAFAGHAWRRIKRASV